MDKCFVGESETIAVSSFLKVLHASLSPELLWAGFIFSHLFCSAAQHLSSICRSSLTLSQTSWYLWAPLAAVAVLGMRIPSCFKPPDHLLCNLHLGLPLWKMGKKETPWPQELLLLTFVQTFSYCLPWGGSPLSPAYPTHSQSALPALGLAVFLRADSSPSQRRCPRLTAGGMREAGCRCWDGGLGEDHEVFWPLGPPIAIIKIMGTEI